MLCKTPVLVREGAPKEPCAPKGGTIRDFYWLMIIDIEVSLSLRRGLG